MGKLLNSATALVIAMGLTACGDSWSSKKIEDPLNVVDASQLNDVMLATADPNAAVTHFHQSLSKAPDRIDLQRGLAISLMRAKRHLEAIPVFETLVKHPQAEDQDRINFAGALIRSGDWKQAEQQLDQVPPTIETLQRYRLEAMIADGNKKWQKADSFYEIANGLTTRPANVLNNWGFSKLTRGDHKAAEKLFIEAITHDPNLFISKNNLVLARAARGDFSLPVIPMTEIERAQLLHTAGLSAAKQGESGIARGLFEDAIDAHPRHFPEAVRSLDGLNKTVAG